MTVQAEALPCTFADYLNFKSREDLGFIDNKRAESMFIEINRKSDKNVIDGIVYRPPDQNLNEFP